MEQKFRAVLKERLAALGAHVKEIPGDRGTSLEITIGGGRKWRLDPQVNLLGSKPDFVLTCDDTVCAPHGDLLRRLALPRQPPAQPARRRRRQARHPARRRALRPQHVVGRPRGQHGRERPGVVRPQVAVGHIMTSSGLGLKPAHFDLLAAAAMDLLMSLDPVPRPRRVSRAIGDALPFVLAARAQQRGQHRDSAVTCSRIAGELLDGHGAASRSGRRPGVGLAR